MKYRIRAAFFTNIMLIRPLMSPAWNYYTFFQECCSLKASSEEKYSGKYRYSMEKKSYAGHQKKIICLFSIICKRNNQPKEQEEIQNS